VTARQLPPARRHDQPRRHLYASASATYGSAGSNSTEVQGQLVDNGDGTATISFTYTAGAVDAAVVNGTQFGSSRTKAYHRQVSAVAAALAPVTVAERT
jgi:hypothetical protein